MMDTNGKVKTGILGVVALAVLVLSIVTMAVSISVRDDLQRMSSGDILVAANGTLADPEPQEQPRTVQDAPVYVLKLEADGIQVLDSVGDVIRRVECHAAFLPAADRDALEGGIEVFSEEELFSLIEDFTG